MATDPPLAVPLDPFTRPALAVLVNFGVATGRDPSREEIDELARELRRHVRTSTITAEQRYEVGEQVEILLHEVRIEVPDDVVEEMDEDALAVRARILDVASAWAARCVEKVGGPMTLAQRLAREAVVDRGDETPPASPDSASPR